MRTVPRIWCVWSMPTRRSSPRVLFCGSGTVNIDACISSLTPAGKKILIVNNGAYSDRGREVCDAYHMDYVKPAPAL